MKKAAALSLYFLMVGCAAINQQIGSTEAPASIKTEITPPRASPPTDVLAQISQDLANEGLRPEVLTGPPSVPPPVPVTSVPAVEAPEASPTPSVLSASSATAKEADSIAACDQYAAHPDDPERPAEIPGVSDEQVQTFLAIPECTAAVDLDPGEPRLKFQLARAYLFDGRNEEALDLLMEAAQEGHGASLAYLADVTVFGAGGLESDPGLAKILYQRAAEAGFKPAAMLASQIIPDAVPDPNAQKAPEVVFHHPAFVTAMSARKGPQTSEPWSVMAHYAMGGLVGIGTQCPAAVPDRPWEIEFFTAAQKRSLRDMNHAFDMAARRMSGQFDEVLQQGMDDGYGLALTKGCDAREIKNFVYIAAAHFDV